MVLAFYVIYKNISMAEMNDDIGTCVYKLIQFWCDDKESNTLTNFPKELVQIRHNTYVDVSFYDDLICELFIK